MKHLISELTGPKLDQAVALALGWEAGAMEGIWIDRKGELMDNFHPSENWAQLGQLITEFKIGLEPPHNQHTWWFAHVDMDMGQSAEGLSPQIAICRAIVASKFGEYIEIPE